MSGPLPLDWWPPTPILWSTWWVDSDTDCRVPRQDTSPWQTQIFVLLLCCSSPTWCPWWSGQWSWAPMSPPPACGTAWLWPAPPSPTVDTTSPSCLPQNSMTFTISGVSTSLFSSSTFFFFLKITAFKSEIYNNCQPFLLPGSTSVLVCSACWIVSTAQTTNSGRANSTSATCCWPASRLWTKASPIRPRRLSDGLRGSPHRPLDPFFKLIYRF